ncbi:FcoT family thioesterase [Actinokineospora sp. PR83]|uniref:FcoT family thioesterase n=1 Tax=Actinokineospora sp. PR83 TaxID=2884908 RepID=UPI0027DEC9F5|nr:FcoT family thioesterase [Actinokineospora sp. PR83]MCG8914478.1 FcoT family thioesterase [Actinokineospora sp. PR83]
MSAVLPPVLDSDRELLARVLDCYKPHCRYLASFAVSQEEGVLRGAGVLEIPESCYIDDTGHLNSVEVNICYNQMLYQVIATAVRDGIGPVFDTWTMADFWRRRLPDVLITRFSSVFRRPIDPRSFHGEFALDSVRQRRLRPDADPLVSLETSFRCWDEAGGACSGTAQVTIVGS